MPRSKPRPKRRKRRSGGGQYRPRVDTLILIPFRFNGKTNFIEEGVTKLCGTAVNLNRGFTVQKIKLRIFPGNILTLEDEEIEDPTTHQKVAVPVRGYSLGELSVKQAGTAWGNRGNINYIELGRIPIPTAGQPVASKTLRPYGAGARAVLENPSKAEAYLNFSAYGCTLAPGKSGQNFATVVLEIRMYLKLEVVEVDEGIANQLFTTMHLRDHPDRHDGDDASPAHSLSTWSVSE